MFTNDDCGPMEVDDQNRILQQKKDHDALNRDLVLHTMKNDKTNIEMNVSFFDMSLFYEKVFEEGNVIPFTCQDDFKGKIKIYIFIKIVNNIGIGISFSRRYRKRRVRNEHSDLMKTGGNF